MQTVIQRKLLSTTELGKACLEESLGCHASLVRFDFRQWKHQAMAMAITTASSNSIDSSDQQL